MILIADLGELSSTNPSKWTRRHAIQSSEKVRCVAGVGSVGSAGAVTVQQCLTLRIHGWQRIDLALFKLEVLVRGKMRTASELCFVHYIGQDASAGAICSDGQVPYSKAASPYRIQSMYIPLPTLPSNSSNVVYQMIPHRTVADALTPKNSTALR